MTDQLLKERALIDTLKKEIAKKLKSEPADQWQQRDFENLSSHVDQSTRVMLSISTLKRIWKNEYQKLPHKNTLNALVEFIGYKDWYDFVCAHSTPKKINLPKFKLITIRVPKFVYVSASAIAVIVLVFLLFKSKPVSSTFDVGFSSKKIVAQGLPNTVVFDYDISKLEFDSAFVQQSWDMRRRDRVEKDEHQSTSVYYFPGYHHAKLIVDNKVMKEHQIYITTADWISYVQNAKNELIPVYINEDFKKEGTLHVSTQQLQQHNIDLEKNDYSVSYVIANESIWCDSDNFSLETIVKNSMDDGGVTCQKFTLYLLGTNGMHMLNFCEPGCVGTINQLLGENYIDGKKNDLSGFGLDMDNWQNIKIDIRDKIVSVGIADSIVYYSAYNKSIGKLIGINCSFSGCGSLDFISLKDDKGEVLYIEEFED